MELKPLIQEAVALAEKLGCSSASPNIFQDGEVPSPKPSQQEDVYFLPTWLPPGWKKIVDKPDGAKYSGTKKLTVIVSVKVENDGNAWLHVSVAHPNRLPTYEELKFVKMHFVGRERSAIQFFPPESQHVNIHNYCLHLWSCLSGNVVPDFTQGRKSI